MSKPRGSRYCGTKLRRNLFTGGAASGNRDGAGDDAVAIETVIFEKDFPLGRTDTVVRYRDIVGKVQPAQTPDAFGVMDFRIGQTRTFKINVVRRQFRVS